MIEDQKILSQSLCLSSLANLDLYFNTGQLSAIDENMGFGVVANNAERTMHNPSLTIGTPTLEQMLSLLHKQAFIDLYLEI